MIAAVEAKKSDVADLCAKRRVLRLALFGSAAQNRFQPSTSDLDFVVEFSPMSPAEHLEAYFGLQEDLERLLGVPVDLVEKGPIRNPYFQRAIDQTQVILYEAA